ncbi:hypothetical protein Tco_1465075 [Tanacetum coccineum]
MSTHEQLTNNHTSAVRNTGGRNGPQGLEEPMSDEVLREMCDKNYHQLLPLIAEKMQKEKEQKDKLNAVKARLIYGEESGIKIRSREESHYSESKTPTARTEPRRRHGGRYSRSPSPHASVFKRLKKNRSPSPRPRPRKEGGVFNRLGRKEPATSARPDSRQRSPRTKRNEVYLGLFGGVNCLAANNMSGAKMTTSVGNNSVFRSFFEKQKLTGPNFIDWYRQLRLVLSTEDKENYLEHPIPATPVAQPGQYVVPTGRVVVPTGRYVVPAGKVISSSCYWQLVIT